MDSHLEQKFCIFIRKLARRNGKLNKANNRSLRESHAQRHLGILGLRLVQLEVTRNNMIVPRASMLTKISTSVIRVKSELEQELLVLNIMLKRRLKIVTKILQMLYRKHHLVQVSSLIRRRRGNRSHSRLHANRHLSEIKLLIKSWKKNRRSMYRQ